MDLTNLLGTQHVDHVFGNKFAHLTDSGESFDHNRIDKVLFLETIEIPDRDLFNHFLPASGISRTVFRGKTCRVGNRSRFATHRTCGRKGIGMIFCAVTDVTAH